MNKDKYPFYYYLILLIFLLLALLFWLIIFSIPEEKLVLSNPAEKSYPISSQEKNNYNRSYLPIDYNEIQPIDTSKIIIDTTSNRKIISNLVNIALKSNQVSILKLADDIKKIYPSNEYQIIYMDSVINRLQIKLPEKNRITFKAEIKAKLNQYKLLVWDEAMFSYEKTYTDPKLKDQKSNWYIRATNIEKAWDQNTGNKNIIIAVVDNGFDLNHPELKGKSVKPYNVVEKTTNVSPAQINHGTHVASTIIANGNNGEGLVGTCPDCSFMPIKVQDANGNMSGTYIIDAILYAIKNKASVINLSLGMQIAPGLIPTDEQKKYINSGARDEEEFWNDLFSYANEKNVTCVLASGNSNIMTGFDPFQRSKFTIKVGAVNEHLEKAPFSNYGNLTTIYAPGTNIFGASSKFSYETLQGTSMASPIIAGVVGLIKADNKNITNEEIIKIIQNNSKNKNGIKIFYFNKSLKQ